MKKSFFLPSLCLIGLMSTFQEVAGINLSISYPNTVGGACLNELATATCTIMSSTLRWRVTNDQSGTEYYTFILTANEADIGREFPSNVDVTIFQNNTVRNNSDISQSLIMSELRLLLSSSLTSATITCSDGCREERVQARILDNLPPTKLSQLGVVASSDTATVYFIWEPPPSFPRSDIVEYILRATAAVDSQSQSKNTTLTGSSLELSAFINYSITVQQRTKCMDISDPATILFEQIREPAAASTMSARKPMSTMGAVSTMEPEPLETTTSQPNSNSDSSVVLIIAILLSAVLGLMVVATSLLTAVYIFKKHPITCAPKYPKEVEDPGQEHGVMVLSATESKSVTND